MIKKYFREELREVLAVSHQGKKNQNKPGSKNVLLKIKVYAQEQQ